jgi:hypothetical protein
MRADGHRAGADLLLEVVGRKDSLSVPIERLGPERSNSTGALSPRTVLSYAPRDPAIVDFLVSQQV